MLSEDQIDVISGALVPLYQQLEEWVITDIAARIKKTLAYTRTAELEIQALQKLGFSPVRIRARVMKLLRADKAFQKQVEQNTLEFKKQVAEELTRIRKAALDAGDELMGSAGDMTWADDLELWRSSGVDLKEDGSLKQITDAMKKQTRGELKNLTNTTGFRTASGMESIRDAYQKELDKALVKLSSGATTKEKCVEEVIKDLAQSGLRTIDYDSGRSYQLDTAARMCINTAAAQLAAKVSDSNIQKTDVSLVQVSAHWGARDKGEGIQNHKEWQGKVYSVDGKLHPEEEKRIHMEIHDLKERTGYDVHSGEGDVEGLHGANCRHNHYPFFEGISQPVQYPPEPEPKEINGRIYTYYDMTQGMRRRERQIRALKREREALKTLGENTDDINAKIKERTKEYKDFCKQCDLREKPERLWVEGKTSDLPKTKAWRRYEGQRAAKSNEPGKAVHFDDRKSYRIDLDGYSEEINNGLSKAVREVAAEGDRTGWEHMRLVNLKTGSLECSHTDKEAGSVGGKVLWDFLKEHPDEEFAFVHNHNAATELSLPDVELMMNEKQLPVVASVRNDGIIYLVESNGKHSDEIPYLRYEKEADEFSRTYADKSDQGRYSREKELLFRNLVIQEFAKGGMKEYGNS